MRLLHVLLASIFVWSPATAIAQRSPVVVELFTSQGCGYCPPADAILAELAERPEVIALALHVTYWDYLGWKDSFGHEVHDGRQRGYAKTVRERTVYTPQIIVQGVDRVGGAKHDRVMALVEEHQSRPPQVRLDVRRDGRTLDVSLAPVGPTGVGPCEIHVVRFIAGDTVHIEAGENAGHRVSYVNVVTHWGTVGAWDGRTPLDLSVELEGPEHVAVIVQRDRLGPVLSAAKLP